MASSPDQFERLAGESDYMRGWESLGAMIAQGRSFSGHERNCCFLNTGMEGRRFADVSGALGFDHDDDGRAIIPVDWDGDGDLDLWLANRTGPRLRFLRNDLPVDDARWLRLKLRGVDCNRDAIGARVEVGIRSADGSRQTLVRALRAGDGFASQTPKTLHLGLGEGGEVEEVRVHWPGSNGEGEAFSGTQAGSVFELVQGEGVARKLELPSVGSSDWKPSTPAQPPAVASRRIVLSNPAAIPALDFVTLQGEKRSLESARAGEALLVVLWSYQCASCMTELPSLAADALKMRDAGLRVVALTTDILEVESLETVKAAESALAGMGWNLDAGLAPVGLVHSLNRVHENAVYPERPLALPASFLIDGEGRVAVLYRGPVDVEALITDAGMTKQRPASMEDAAFPFPGRTSRPLFRLGTPSLAGAYRAAGYIEDARRTLVKEIAKHESASDESSKQRAAALYWHLADLEESEGNFPKALEALREAVVLQPQNASLHLSLAATTSQAGASEEAEALFEKLAAQAPDNADWLDQIGNVCRQVGRTDRAVEFLERAHKLAPESAKIRFNLAVACESAARVADAVKHYRALAAKKEDTALDAANNLAWILATDPDGALRDGSEAVRLATRVVESTRHQSAPALDTLAAAHAEAGDFPEAVALAEKAAALAKASGESMLAEEIASRTEFYRDEKPFRGAN